MNRRAQAQRILIYALTAIVGAMILLFGYRVIVSLTGSGDKLMLSDFRTAFTRDVDLASSYGSVQTKSYRLPAAVHEICVIELDESPDLDARTYPTIRDSWESDAEANVFLLPTDFQFTVDAIQIADHASLCMPVRGTVRIRMFGEGNRTRIEYVS